MASGLTFKSFIYFEFIFVHGVRKCSNYILFFHVSDQFFQHHLLKSVSSHCIVLSPLSQITWPYVWICFWAVSFVPLVYISCFVPVLYCFDWCSWSQLVWYIQLCSSHDCFGYSGSFSKQRYRVICSSSIEHVMIILIQIAWNLLIALGKMHILTLLISPTYEHERFPFLFIIFNSLHKYFLIFRV